MSRFGPGGGATAGHMTRRLSTGVGTAVGVGKHSWALEGEPRPATFLNLVKCFNVGIVHNVGVSFLFFFSLQTN